jgi:N-methylhydantoinase B
MTEGRDAATERLVDDNVGLHADGSARCRHCGAVLGDATDVLRDARWRRGEASDAGPCIRADARRFVDEPVILRQAFCPNCLSLLLTEIVSGSEPFLRTKALATPMATSAPESPETQSAVG